MIFTLHSIEKLIMFRVLTIFNTVSNFIEVLACTTLIGSVYGRFFMEIKMTVILRHNCIIVC